MTGSTTTRGLLSEMIAPIARWPLRSPVRFVSVLVGIVLTLVVLAHLLGGTQPRGGQPKRSGVSTSSPSQTAETHDNGRPVINGSTLSSEAPGASPTSVAAEFMVAWARPKLLQGVWWTGITRTKVDPGLAAALQETDPSSIPASRVVGVPRLVRSTSSSAVVRVRTDGPSVLVVLTRETGAGGRWMVSNLLPAAGRNR